MHQSSRMTRADGACVLCTPKKPPTSDLHNDLQTNRMLANDTGVLFQAGRDTQICGLSLAHPSDWGRCGCAACGPARSFLLRLELV